MLELIIESLRQLPPGLAVLFAVLIGAVIWQARENRILRKELEDVIKQREDVIKQKDLDLKEVAAVKDRDNKEMTEKLIELHERTIISNEKLSNNISINTEVTKRVDSHLETNQKVQETLIHSVHAVLSNLRNN